MITIYTDGSCLTNPGNGGWAAIISQDGKIKKITVKPKSELSYQSHKYRNEHWIVLKGIATIKKNEKSRMSKSKSRSQ